MSSRSCLIEEAAVQPIFDGLLKIRAPAQVGLMLGKLEVGARDFIVALVPSPDKIGDDDDDSNGGGGGSGSKKATTALGSKTAGGGGGGGGGTESFEVDEDWIVEHSRQVSRMLPGGISVVGLYAFGSDAAMKAATPALHRAAAQVAAAAAGDGGDSSRAAPGSRHQTCDERLILHLSSSTRKYALKRCNVSASGHGGENSRGGGSAAAAAVSLAAMSSPSPVEHKMGRVMNNLVCVEARYRVDAVLAGPDPSAPGRGGRPADLRAMAAQLVESEAARIVAGEVLLGGVLRHPDDQMASISTTVAEGGSGASAGDSNGDSYGNGSAMLVVHAELLCPPRSSVAGGAASSACNRKGAEGGGCQRRWEARVQGVVSARAYAYSRETVGRAATDLKADIVASLRVRLDLLIDEADREADDDDAVAVVTDARDGERAREGMGGGDDSSRRQQRRRHPLTEGAAPPSAPATVGISLPRRAWVRWVDGCAVCDYLVRGESTADVVERCGEVLNWEVPGGAAGVVDAEAPATPAPTGAAPVGGGRRAGTMTSGGDSEGVVSSGKRIERGAGAAGEAAAPSSSSTSSVIKSYAVGAGVAIITAALSIVALDELDLYDFY